MKLRYSRPVRLVRAILTLIVAIGVTLPRTATASDNVAVRILQMDSQVKPVTLQMLKILDGVMDDACARIRKLPKTELGAWDPVFAESALKCIDDALVSHGFLYPDAGLVDQLADTLTPFQMTASRRYSFEQQRHNERRKTVIEQRFPGPFYVADCDTACFIYLGVADRLNLPIHFIDLPGFDAVSGHNIVRWREGTHFIDWETMDGCVKSDDYYKDLWQVTPDELEARAALTDLTTDQVIGYEHALVAIQYQRRGDYEHALRELETSLRMYPQDMLACNNYAWDTAVGSNVKWRNYPEAITRTLFVLNLVNDPNVRDTLAAVYASSGMYNLAVSEEDAVVSKSDSTAFKDRLELYRQHKAYTEFRATPGPEGVFTP